MSQGGTIPLPKPWQEPKFGVGLPAGKGGTGPVVFYPTEYKWTSPWKHPKGITWVIWRHLRSTKEVNLAERKYAEMLALRDQKTTPKKFGKVEPRPFMIPALEKCRKSLLEVWKDEVG